MEKEIGRRRDQDVERKAVNRITCVTTISELKR